MIVFLSIRDRIKLLCRTLQACVPGFNVGELFDE